MSRAAQSVVVLANDVVPGMGLPVAAPGLRAWGLATGLRAHGYRVTVVVDDNIVQLAWRRPFPPPTPPHTVVLPRNRIGEFVRSRRPSAVVMTNSNLIDDVGDLGDSALVYDFFAPKVLEFEQLDDAAERGPELERLVDRKLRALARSAAVIVNGEKKVPYVEDWLGRAGVKGLPSEVVVMPLPTAFRPRAKRGAPIHAVVTGYIQAWSRPGEWTDALEHYLSNGSMVLHLMVSNHWGGGIRDLAMPKAFSKLQEMPNVRLHPAMEIDDFRAFLSLQHLSIDLFERNDERELAMVTRTMVAISCGLPAIHVPFTETSELIKRHDAGWLVSPSEPAELDNVLLEATQARGVLSAKRDGAVAMAASLEPEVAVEPLVGILQELLR
jgi:hypothetical protein